MAMMESLLDCEVCMESYTEIQRRPRSLPCGHSMCHSCIKDSLKTNMGFLECPFCRCKCCSEPKTAEDFPATYAILRMLEPEQTVLEDNKNSSASKNYSYLSEDKQTQLAITESYAMSCKEKVTYLEQHKYELESHRNLMQKHVDEYMREVERKNTEIKNLDSQIEKELNVITEVMGEGKDIQVRLEELKSLISIVENVEEVDEQQIYSSSQDWNLTVATLLGNSTSLDDIEKSNEGLMVAQHSLAGEDKTKISNKNERELRTNEKLPTELNDSLMVAQCELAGDDKTTISYKLEKELRINEQLNKLRIDEKLPSEVLSDIESSLQCEKSDGLPEVFIKVQELHNLLASPTFAKITRLTLHLEVEPMSPLPHLPQGAFSHISLLILGVHTKLEDHQAGWCGRFIGHLLAGRGGRCNRLVLHKTHITDSGACDLINSLGTSGVCITECFKIISSVGLYSQKETELRKLAKSSILQGWDFKWKMSDNTKFYVNLLD